MKFFASNGIAIFVGSLLFCGCGNSDSSDSLPISQTANCPTKTAVISVGDAYLQALCGCGASNVGPATQNVHCSVNSGVSIVFLFQAVHYLHQIVSLGSPAFSASPVIDPHSRVRIQSFSFQLKDVGTYHFKDAMNASFSGTILVN